MSESYIVNLSKLSLFFFASALITSCSSSFTLQNGSEQLKPQTEKVELSQVEAPKQPPIVKDKNITLSNLVMNEKGAEVTVKPGTPIHASIHYNYHCQECNSSTNNQIIIGLARRSAQACVYNGGSQGEGNADFYLKVPAKPGRYEVRFRGLQALDCNEALKTGWNADNSPSRDTTIGKIIVSRKAEA